MNKLKKLVVCVVTLCATISVFGLAIEDHPASRKAQKQLENQMLSYLNQGKAKSIKNLFKDIPDDCDHKDKVYQENQLPTKCQTGGRSAVEVRVNHPSDPRYIRSGVPVPTVNPEWAFESALKKYFALKNNPKYLDYNKMASFYKENRDSWAGGRMSLWTDDGHLGGPFAIFAFWAKAHKADDMGGFDGIVYYQMAHGITVNKWYEEAVNIYHDKATFYQVKWNCFFDTVTTNGLQEWDHWDFLANSKFWENFAITPVSADAKIRARQMKEIRASLRKEYKRCMESHSWRVAAGICEDIRKNAIQYGYWYSPEEEQAAKKRETEVYISTHVRR